MNAFAKRPIRIAYVLNTQVRAGVEEHVLSLADRLDRARFLPYVVAPPGLVEAFGEDLARTGAKVLPLGLKGVFDWAGMRKFYRFLLEERIDIVNTHMFQASFQFTPIAWLARVPVRMETSHGVEKWRLDKGFVKRHSFCLDRAFASMQCRILAVSHACGRDLMEVKGIRPEKIEVVQNGRDLRQFDPGHNERREEIRRRHGCASEDWVFGVLARLDFQKGHSYLLDAVARLAELRDGFKVLLVGDGPLAGELRAQVERLGLGDRVIFAGFQRDVVGYYSAVDTMVLPSLYEGLPLCVIEAMAMGLPVIATDVDGTPEVVKNWDNGILVPARDSETLSVAMSYALDHGDRMAAMGKNARSWVLERFSLERQVRETEDLYEKLIAVGGVSHREGLPA